MPEVLCVGEELAAERKLGIVEKQTAVEVGMTEQQFDLMEEGLGRAPNQAEFAMFLSLWSEQVASGSSRELISELDGVRPDNFLPGIGLTAFDADNLLAISCSERNHFTNIAPKLGAEITVGAVLDQMMEVGGEPLFLSHSLCLGDADKLATQAIAKETVSGLSRVGNIAGIPSFPLSLEFSQDYDSGFLLSSTCVGLVPKSSMTNSGKAEIGSPIVYFGLPVGSDGLVGQDGGPPRLPVVDIFYQTRLARVIRTGREQGIFKTLLPVGEGALAASLVILAARVGSGFDLQLDKLPSEDSNFHIVDLLMSKTPHRFLAAIDKDRHREANDLFANAGFKLETVGKVEDSDDVSLIWHHKEVAQLPYSFALGKSLYRQYGLIDSPPMLKRRAEVKGRGKKKNRVMEASEFDSLREQVGSDSSNQAQEEIPKKPSHTSDLWVDMLADPNLVSRSAVNRHFDFFGSGLTISNDCIDAPIVGSGLGDSLAFSTVSLSQYVKKEPWLASAHALAAGLRNISSVGAEGFAVSSNFSISNPGSFKDISELSDLIRGVRDVCSQWGLKMMADRVSLYNGNVSSPITSNAAITVVGRMPGAKVSVGAGFKDSGDRLLLVGNTLGQLGCSDYFTYYHRASIGLPPDIDLDSELASCKLVSSLVREGVLKSAHDIGRGGLALAMTESCVVGSRAIGAKLQLDLAEDDFEANGLVREGVLRDDYFLFSESPGRFLLSCSEKDYDAVVAKVSSVGIPIEGVGVIGGKNIEIDGLGPEKLSIPVKTLYKVWSKGLSQFLGDYL